MDDIIQIETIVLELLFIVSIVAIAVRRFRIPYTVALVLVGLALSFRSPLEVQLTEDLILALFIPPLVFEAAFHINFDKLRRNMGTIALLAIPGVVLTMLIVGSIVAWGTDLPLAPAMVFGALVAATDPVSVVALFRKMGAPKRLEVLLEGESLFNDGTAIVIFHLALGIMATGEFHLVDGLIDFLVVAGGGIVVGLVLGWLVSWLIGRVDDYLVETTLTTVLAFGTYLLAEQVHVSGVLAVVAAGLVNGNLSSQEMSPTTRIVVFNFWEYAAFLASSAVFLLIGLEIDLPALLSNWRPILWAIVGVLISRGINIYLISRIGRSMPEKWRHVMFWGGLRGAIALALALSLPGTFGAERTTVLVMTFGVVLFTLLGQGMTMDWLVRRLKLIERSEAQIEYERRHARALASRASYEHTRRLHRDGLISSHSWDRLDKILRDRVDALTAAVQEALNLSPELEQDELITARREGLRAQRSLFSGLRRAGVISDETYEDLISEVDATIESGVEAWAARIAHRAEAQPIKHLMAIVVHDRDMEAAAHALAEQGISVTRVLSTGGFLRQRNHTLLLGMPENTIEKVVNVLERYCRHRVEYLPPNLAGTEIPLGTPKRIEVKGATVFVIDVERAEVI